MVRNVNRYACCEEPFPDVTVNFHIRRKTAYHSYNIIAPCVMLSMLTMVVFWLPCDAGEKINLGLTVLLAFSVFMLMIGETMPETSDAVPLLGLYILSTEFIASLSVGSTVAILNFHYRGTKRNPVPNWLRKLTFRYMTRITFIRPLYSDDGKLLNRPPHTLPGYNHHKKNYMVDASKVYRNYNVKDGASTLNHVDPTADAEQSHHLEELRRLIGFSNNANYAQTSCDSMQSPNLSYMSTSLFSTAPLVPPDGDVVGRIKRLLNKFDEDKMVEETFAEWIEVGRIFDRFCFGVFFLLIFCTTLFLLVIYPLRDENG
ncbi:hypothetical protein RvY_13790-1 [Ramazzottius varieornatus]|uniref:Neurotransmitter-gated ion-channel transmembrane domain-containing protein n=1 Tax=Ramazzottius varieornatus TaxID=947166 RepID=A0A1D1VT35_RAMVA|nr:hypothetical protein RvY_13790-1 [Ramazzottius varieornatus]